MKSKEERNFKQAYTNQQKYKNISKKSIDKFTEETNAATECRLAPQEELHNNTKKSLISFNSLKSLNSKKSIILNPNFIKQQPRNNQNQNYTDADSHQHEHEFIITEQNTQKQNGFQIEYSSSEFQNCSLKSKKNRGNFSLGTKIASQPQSINEKPIFIQRNCQIAVFLSQKRMVFLEFATDLDDQRINTMLKKVLNSIYSFQNQRDFNFCKEDKKYCCDLRRIQLTKFYLEQLQTPKAIKSPKYSYKLASKYYKKMVQQMNQCCHKVNDQLSQQHAILPLTLEAQRQWRQNLIIKMQQQNQDKLKQKDILFEDCIDLQQKNQVYDDFMLKQKSQRQAKEPSSSQSLLGRYLRLKLKDCLDYWLVKSILQKFGCDKYYQQLDKKNKYSTKLKPNNRIK